MTIDVGESSLDPGAATDERRVVAHLDPGMLTEGEVDVQVAHGPVTADGGFDEARLTVIDMTAVGGGRFTASFTPGEAGRWGVMVRALPTHPLLTNPFDTGLVATD